MDSHALKMRRFRRNVPSRTTHCRRGHCLPYLHFVSLCALSLVRFTVCPIFSLLHCVPYLHFVSLVCFIVHPTVASFHRISVCGTNYVHCTHFFCSGSNALFTEKFLHEPCQTGSGAPSPSTCNRSPVTGLSLAKLTKSLRNSLYRTVQYVILYTCLAEFW